MASFSDSRDSSGRALAIASQALNTSGLANALQLSGYSTATAVTAVTTAGFGVEVDAEGGGGEDRLIAAEQHATTAVRR